MTRRKTHRRKKRDDDGVLYATLAGIALYFIYTQFANAGTTTSTGTGLNDPSLGLSDSSSW